jgi:hypothetical protein
LTIRFELQTWQIPEFKITTVSTQLDYPTKTAEACLLFVTILLKISQLKNQLLKLRFEVKSIIQQFVVESIGVLQYALIKQRKSSKLKPKENISRTGEH